MIRAPLPVQPAPSGSPYSDDLASESLTSRLIKSSAPYEDSAADVDSHNRILTDAPPQTHHPHPERVPDKQFPLGGAGSGHNQVQVQVLDSHDDGSVVVSSTRVPSTGQGGAQAGTSGFQKLKRRNKRPAKFPTPVDLLFAQLEPGKVWFTIAVGTVTVLTSNQRNGAISEEFMENLLILTTLCLLLLTAANLLQNLIPEVAVVAMLAGVSTAVASAHALILSALPQNKRFLVIYPVFPGYFSLLLVILFKILKEDVREPENIANN